VSIAGFAVYFADGIRSYEKSKPKIISNNPNLMAEINNLTKK